MINNKSPFLGRDRRKDTLNYIRIPTSQNMSSLDIILIAILKMSPKRNFSGYNKD